MSEVSQAKLVAAPSLIALEVPKAQFRFRLTGVKEDATSADWDRILIGSGGPGAWFEKSAYTKFGATFDLSGANAVIVWPKGSSQEATLKRNGHLISSKPYAAAAKIAKPK